MTYAIPTDIGVVDRDRNGYADRFYFGDTGGNVWRANIASTKPGGDSSTTPPTPAWNAYKLATFQTKVGSETDASRHRKFAYSPDVVAGPDGAAYDMVIVGSGDREQPFDKTVVNRLYVIKDDNSIPGTPLIETSTGMYALQPGDLDPTNGSYSLTDVTAKGWFYTLTEAGEKIVSSPVTVNGISFFNTNIPRDDCSSGLGEARIYALEVLTGQAPVYSGTDGTTYSAYKTVPGGGFLPTGVPAIVEIGGTTREVLLVGTRVTQDIGVIQLNRRVRTFWYQGIDQ
jgi:type IV pilus assembly protein PilY1